LGVSYRLGKPPQMKGEMQGNCSCFRAQEKKIKVRGGEIKERKKGLWGTRGEKGTGPWLRK